MRAKQRLVIALLYVISGAAHGLVALSRLNKRAVDVLERWALDLARWGEK